MSKLLILTLSVSEVGSILDFVHSEFCPIRDFVRSGFCPIRDFVRSGFPQFWDFIFWDFVRKRLVSYQFDGIVYQLLVFSTMYCDNVLRQQQQTNFKPLTSARPIARATAPTITKLSLMKFARAWSQG